MKRSLSPDAALFYTMSLVGGFLGGYAILGRCDVFGSAQTANLIHFVLDLLGGSPVQLLLRLAAALLYAAGIALAVLLPKYTKLKLKPVSIAADCAAVLLLGFLPAGMDSLIALYPVFFVTAFQLCAFPGALGYTSSCIFSTNNFRQSVAALTEYLCTGERESGRKARFFGGSLLSYHLGVAAALTAVRLWQLRGVWFCLLPLAAAAVQYGRSLRRTPASPGAFK